MFSDSSPQTPDNLHSSNEHKGVDIQRHQVNSDKNPSSVPSTAVTSAADVKAQQPRQQSVDSSIIKPLHKVRRTIWICVFQNVEDLSGSF